MIKAVFDVVVSSEEPALKYVYPIMQKHVKQLIDQAKEVHSIKGIILFGSSVDLTCGWESDLDLVFIFDEALPQERRDEAVKQCRRGITVPMDILTHTWEGIRWDAKENSIYKEALENGIIIYKRG